MCLYVNVYVKSGTFKQNLCKWILYMEIFIYVIGGKSIKSLKKVFG